MKRRDFLGTAALMGAAMAAGKFAPAQTTEQMDQRAAARLRLCSQLGGIPGNSNPEKLEKLKKWGGEAFEVGGEVADDAVCKEYNKLKADFGLEISAICWGSCGGQLVSTDPAVQAEGMESFKRVLEGAGKVGARGVIHVPTFNGQSELSNQELLERCRDYLPKLGEFAVAHNTTIILEPLCRYETYFIKQVAYGASICRDCGGREAGITVMGDFYHMDSEETSNMGAFISAGDYLNHVHLAGGRAEPMRTLPGQNGMSFVDGFRGLKYIGYTGFCSFECGCEGDREVEMPKSMQFLRDQWAMA